MPVSLEQLEEQALGLSPEDRAKLAEALLESLHVPMTDIDVAWEMEVQRRVAAFDRGELPAYAAEDLFAEAHRLVR
jgi:putative addiction module component (TIGR02574 family)